MHRAALITISILLILGACFAQDPAARARCVERFSPRTRVATTPSYPVPTLPFLLWNELHQQSRALVKSLILTSMELSRRCRRTVDIAAVAGKGQRVCEPDRSEE
jgi:hypothetical protein